MIWTIIGALIVGTILGYLGKLFLPGRQNIPAWATIGTGVVAALLGGWFATLIGVGATRGFDWIKFFIEVVFAVIGIAIVARLMGGRGAGTATRDY